MTIPITKRNPLNLAVIKSLTGNTVSTQEKRALSRLLTQVLPALAAAGLVLPSAGMAANFNDHNGQGRIDGNVMYDSDGTVVGEITNTSARVYGFENSRSEEEFKDESDASISVSNSTVGDIYGGYSTYGTASSNTVNLNGKVNVTDSSIDGGLSIDGAASDNKVIINEGSTVTVVHTSSSGSTTGTIQGGTSDNGDAFGNTIKISGSTVTVGGSMYGGFGETTVSGNTVEISNSKVTAGSTIYGGESNRGSATGNSISITDGSDITVSTICGGRSFEDVSGNSVEIIGVKVQTADGGATTVFGGYTFNGSAAENTVTIDSNSSFSQVAGGYNYSGDGGASDNQVNIKLSGGATLSQVYGGYSIYGNGGASGNTVTIEGDISTASSIYGGASNTGSGTISGNTLTINGGNEIKTVYGGRSNNNGNVSENTITIGGDVKKISAVYAGRSTSGNVSKNTVTINAGTDVSSIYGGYSSGSGNITENTVNLNGGTITGAIYAGYSVSGTVQNNILNLDGASKDKTADLNVSKAFLYGSNIAVTGLNGNTLNIRNFSGRIRNIANFDTINIDLTGVDMAAAVYNSGSVIVLTDSSGAGTNLNNSTVNIYSSTTHNSLSVAFTSESGLSDEYTVIANENGAMTKDGAAITDKIMVVQDPNIYTDSIEYSEYDLVADEDGTISYIMDPDTAGTYTPDPEPTPEPTPTPDPGPGPSPVPDTDEGKTVTALAGTGAKLSMYYAQLDDLRKRLGEVRYGAQEGIWARFIYQQDSFAGTSSYGAKQRWYGLNLGLDRIVSKDESRMWLMGANFKYGHAKQKVKQHVGGKGNLNDYGVNVYATYANQYGCYADFVVTFDEYKQKLGVKSEGISSSGDYNSWGWGASIELGKMFSFKSDDGTGDPWQNHWWIEPQAQLSYYWLKGKDFAMSSGKTLEQNNGQSLVGRLGLVAGKQWSYGGTGKDDRRYVQAYLKGGVKHEFLGKQDMKYDGKFYNDRLRGTTGYYGAGVDWNMSKKLRAYAQVERESGGKYKKDIEASIGLKWQF